MDNPEVEPPSVELVGRVAPPPPVPYVPKWRTDLPGALLLPVVGLLAMGLATAATSGAASAASALGAVAVLFAAGIIALLVRG
jgi:hypothetical protein